MHVVIFRKAIAYMKVINITHSLQYHWIIMNKVIACNTSQPQGRGVVCFTVLFVQILQFCLAHAFASRGRGCQNYFCHRVTLQVVVHRWLRSDWCSLRISVHWSTSPRDLLHLSCKNTCQISDIMFASRIGSSKPYTSQHWQGDFYKSRHWVVPPYPYFF